MNDHYTAERLLKRIFYELFGDIDAQYSLGMLEHVIQVSGISSRPNNLSASLE